MTKSFISDYRTMGKNAAVLCVVCLMLCLSFNNTFPLHRETTKPSGFSNHTQPCIHEKEDHGGSIVDRTIKMAANIEHALKKIIDSTPDKTKKETKCSHVNQGDGDLSNYEQLVIMKKYPFLDLQELDFSYHPQPNKNSKQSLNSDSNLAQDSSFCESSEEGPNVEITNRGLSGFALPIKLLKAENSAEIKINSNDSQNANNTSSAVKQPSDDSRLLKSLEQDIKEFEKHLG